MEPDKKPTTRQRVGRKPYSLPRMTPTEFKKRCLYSRQHESMKNAVQRVVVSGSLVSDVAADLGQTRQNVHDGVTRFLDSTEWPMQHMTPQEFEFASRGREVRASMLQAARLFLVEGYSYAQACKVTGTPDNQVKDLVKRMRQSLRRLYCVVKTPDPGAVYNPPHEGWEWPTAEEIEQLATSCLVRPTKAITYTRAAMVLVMHMSPSEVTKLTTSTRQFVIDSVDGVVERLEQQRFHLRFPKDASYLEDMRTAAAKRVAQAPLREAVEHYLGKEPNLDKAAAKAGVQVDALFRAVRTTVHEMARMERVRMQELTSSKK